ncbi:hypothetical protein Tco_1328303 [Tanacetum coccineum]
MVRAILEYLRRNNLQNHLDEDFEILFENLDILGSESPKKLSLFSLFSSGTLYVVAYVFAQLFSGSGKSFGGMVYSGSGVAGLSLSGIGCKTTVKICSTGSDSGSRSVHRRVTGISCVQ